MQEIEKEQSFDELAVLRNIVMGRVKRERDLAEVGRRRGAVRERGRNGGRDEGGREGVWEW